MAGPGEISGPQGPKRPSPALEQPGVQAPAAKRQKLLDSKSVIDAGMYKAPAADKSAPPAPIIPTTDIKDAGKMGDAALKLTEIAKKDNLPIPLENYLALSGIAKESLTPEQIKKFQAAFASLSTEEVDVMSDALGTALEEHIDKNGKLKPEAQAIIKKADAMDAKALTAEVKQLANAEGASKKGFDIFALLLLLATTQDKIWTDLEATLLSNMKSLVSLFKDQAASIMKKAVIQLVVTCVTSAVSAVGAAVNLKASISAAKAGLGKDTEGLAAAGKLSKVKSGTEAKALQQSAVLQQNSARSQAISMKGSAIAQGADSVGKVGAGVGNYFANMEDAEQAILRGEQAKAQFYVDQQKTFRQKVMSTYDNSTQSAQALIRDNKSTGSVIAQNMKA